MDRIQAAQANAVQYKVPDHPNDSQPVTDANILDYKLSHAKELTVSIDQHGVGDQVQPVLAPASSFEFNIPPQAMQPQAAYAKHTEVVLRPSEMQANEPLNIMPFPLPVANQPALPFPVPSAVVVQPNPPMPALGASILSTFLGNGQQLGNLPIPTLNTSTFIPSAAPPAMRPLNPTPAENPLPITQKQTPLDDDDNDEMYIPGDEGDDSDADFDFQAHYAHQFKRRGRGKPKAAASAAVNVVSDKPRRGRPPKGAAKPPKASKKTKPKAIAATVVVPPPNTASLNDMMGVDNGSTAAAAVQRAPQATSNGIQQPLSNGVVSHAEEDPYIQWQALNATLPVPTGNATYALNGTSNGTTAAAAVKNEPIARQPSKRRQEVQQHQQQSSDLIKIMTTTPQSTKKKPRFSDTSNENSKAKPPPFKEPLAFPADAQQQQQVGISAEPVVPSAQQQPVAEQGLNTGPPPPQTAAAEAPPPQDKAVDYMLGCPKCRYHPRGCGTCRVYPANNRPYARWDPDAGRPQLDIPTAPSFRPTVEEFKDPIAYISKITPIASQYGIAHIIPPEGWNPPFALEKGTNGLGMESFRFTTRKQQTSNLCRRHPPPRPDGGGEAGGNNQGGQKPAEGRYAGVKMSHQVLQPYQPPSQHEEQATEATAEAVVVPLLPPQEEPKPPEQKPSTTLTAADVAAAYAAINGIDPASLLANSASRQEEDDRLDVEIREAEKQAALLREGVVPPAANGGGVPMTLVEPDPEFGFVILDKKHTLRSFAAHSDWVKAVHFADPPPKGDGISTAPKLRPQSLPQYFLPPQEPSVEEVEAEFWRILESPDAPNVESLYGQDLDSGHHGSGFPLPEWRRRLLEQHLLSTRSAKGGLMQPITLPPYEDDREKHYAEHPWNINNMPRCKDSVLRYLLGDGLITGVMVPWLYVGSCLSAFCWHVEDHALYSVNYMHMGAPKVWYAVPPSATHALEEAMKDALPHLFEASPNLLYQLVTMLSPTELKKRGVPVYRIVHEAGSFAITMPNAYHAGFNTGFNCAEAVNFGAPPWIPFGTDVADKYRETQKPTTMSHDSLIVSLVTAAEHIPTDMDSVDTTTRCDVEIVGAKQEQQAEHAPNLPPADVPMDTPPQEQTGFGPLGDIPWADAPRQGVCLAAGELTLRIQEERRRRTAGLTALGLENWSEERRMEESAPPAAKDPITGVFINTEDCDCVKCSCDLWLSAVVSSHAPGVATCPEHADVLVSEYKCPGESVVLLYRKSPEELEKAVEVAAQRVKGVKAAVEYALTRRAKQEAEAVQGKGIGPMYNLSDLPPPPPATNVEALPVYDPLLNPPKITPTRRKRHNAGSLTPAKKSKSKKALLPNGATAAGVRGRKAGITAEARLEAKLAAEDAAAEAAALAMNSPLEEDEDEDDHQLVLNDNAGQHDVYARMNGGDEDVLPVVPQKDINISGDLEDSFGRNNENNNYHHPGVMSKEMRRARSKTANRKSGSDFIGLLRALSTDDDHDGIVAMNATVDEDIPMPAVVGTDDAVNNVDGGGQHKEIDDSLLVPLQQSVEPEVEEEQQKIVGVDDGGPAFDTLQPSSIVLEVEAAKQELPMEIVVPPPSAGGEVHMVKDTAACVAAAVANGEAEPNVE